MKKINKVYISGLGAVGAAYASKLYEMDPSCIKVIADRDRIARYEKTGVKLNGRTYPFSYIAPGENPEPADLILIAVKFHHLKDIVKDIEGFVGPDTIVMSLLNGISSEEIIGAAIGMEKLLYSLVVGIDAVRTGTEVTFTTLGKIVFGERTNTTKSDRVESVKELFDRAGINYSIPENMIKSLWWKFMVNVGINQVSAVLRAPYGVFVKPGEARELMFEAEKEVIALSKAAGIGLEDEDLEEFDRVLKTLSPGGKTSMFQDVEAGRKTEVELFAGTVTELGRKYGVATPLNDTLYRMIRALEQASGAVG